MTAHTYTIPVGPLHVALEEPMYFHIDVEGETVRGVDIRAGCVHRGDITREEARGLIERMAQLKFPRSFRRRRA